MALGAMQHWPLRVTRLVDHAEREHGDGEIVTAWADGSLTRTDWRTVARDGRRMAQALEAEGVKPGERVATLAMNHARHLVAWYGACGMGGVLHTVNPRLFEDQLEFIVNHAEDRILLYDHAFAPLVEHMRARWPGVAKFICFDPPSGGSADPSFEQWIAPFDGDYQWASGEETDPCGLCYTSGTTGDPKGVLYEHRSTMIHAMAEIAPDCFGLSVRSIALPIVPMFHANAWGLPWAAPLVGCKLVLTADYRPDRLVALFRDEGVTHSAGVPTVWLGMIAHIEATGEDLGPLEKVTIGGSAAPRAMIEWFRARGIEVGHAWGMTETSPIGTIGAPPRDWETLSETEKVDYITRQGRVPFGVELRIVDDEGRELARDGKESGRLQIRGPWIVERYFKQDGLAVDGEGWFDTGDVAALHCDGTMQITDRSKDVIKSGGEWISSIDLENAAVGCPGVAEAAAIGLPHPKWDERPLLLCVRAAGSTVTADQVRDHLAGQVAAGGCPTVSSLSTSCRTPPPAS